MADWYQLYGNGLNKAIRDFGGSGLRHYYGSVAKALKAVYPEYPWDESKFQKPHKPHVTHKPQNYWSYLENQQSYFDDLAEKLNIQKHEDWYNVSIQSVHEHGGRGVLSKYRGSLIKALAHVYPNHNWRFYRYYNPHQKNTSSKEKVSKSQCILNPLGSAYCLVTLQHAVKDLFPKNVTFLINHKFKDLPNKLEYDVSSQPIAFEYQGEPHYLNIPIYGSLKQRQLNDTLKHINSQDIGITLICVPYWWNKSRESLAGLILGSRQDIILHNISGKIQSIPQSPPQKLKQYGETVFKLRPCETYNNDLGVLLFTMST